MPKNKFESFNKGEEEKENAVDIPESKEVPAEKREELEKIAEELEQKEGERTIDLTKEEEARKQEREKNLQEAEELASRAGAEALPRAIREQNLNQKSYSLDSTTKIPDYGLKSKEERLEAANEAAQEATKSKPVEKKRSLLDRLLGR